MQSRCFEERERQSFAIISTSLVCAKLSFYGQMRIHLISSFSIESHSNEGRTLNLSKITQPRLVYGSFVTQTRDEEIKGGYDGVVKPDDQGTGYTATSLIPVCPRIEFYIQGIVRSCKISPPPSQSHRNLDAIWVKPSFLSHVYSNRAYYSTRVARESSPRAKREKRGWLDARYEKFQKVGSGKKVGDGKGIRVGIRIAREAKLVGGNLSRGAVRIHLNPPLPSRDSSFESLAEKDLVSAVGEKRLKGESARRSAEIGSFYYRSMPALLSRHGLNKVNRLKAAMHRCEQYPWEVEIHQPFFLSIRAGRRLRNVRSKRRRRGNERSRAK